MCDKSRIDGGAVSWDAEREPLQCLICGAKHSGWSKADLEEWKKLVSPLRQQGRHPYGVSTQQPAPQSIAPNSPMSLELFGQWFKPKIDTAKDPQSEYWQCWQDAVAAANGFAQQPAPRDEGRDLALIEFVVKRWDRRDMWEPNKILSAFLSTQEPRG